MKCILFSHIQACLKVHLYYEEYVELELINVKSPMRPDVVINFVLYFVCIHNVTMINFTCTYFLTYL